MMIQATPEKPLPFEVWSEIAAVLSSLGPDAIEEVLGALKIDLEHFERSQSVHLEDLGKAVSGGDRSLAEHHAADLQKNLTLADLQKKYGSRPPHAPKISIAMAAERLTTGMEWDVTQAPVARPGPALPFKEGTFRPPPVVVDPEADPGGDTVVPNMPKDRTLPFVSTVESRLLRLEGFAALAASLRMRPQDHGGVFAEHGITDRSVFDRVAQYWAKRFLTDSPLRERFETLISKAMAEKERGF